MPEEKNITIVCPRCRTEYRVPVEIEGKKVSCKRCQETFAAKPGNGSPPQLPDMGLLAVKYKLITQEQLSELLSSLSAAPADGNQISVEALLLEKGLLTGAQIETLKLTEELGKVSQMSRRFGALAVKKALITEEVLKDAFQKQAVLFKKAKTVRHIKEILLEEGRITQENHDILMAELENGAPAPQKAPSTSNIENAYDLLISEDGMRAVLKAKSSDSPTASSDAIARLLESKGITHGQVPADQLAPRLAAPIDPEAPIVIAAGTSPEAGRDATLRYHFSTDQKIGTLGTHGEIDFKNKGEVPFVHKGDLLMEKIPATAGTPGYDIYGKELPPPPAGDIKLLFGSGVEPSEDRLKLHAKVDGQPKFSLGGRLSVVSDLVVNGDVDLKSGHIDFEGNVKVTGTIQSGFQVKGANVEAKEIMNAQITASGNVTATGGIIGATIKAQGDITAKYIKHATLSTFGDIIVLKEITDSKINTSGACRLDKGKILSSEISAKQGVEALDIGTDLSSPCRLTVGVDDHVETETEGLKSAISRREERLGQIQEDLDGIEDKQQGIHKEIADLAQIQDRSLVKQRALTEELGKLAAGDSEKRGEMESAISALGDEARKAEESLGDLFDRQDQLTHQSEKLQRETELVKEDIYELKNELEAIRHWAKSQKKAATIKTSGTIVQGTVIAGPHTRTLVKETARHVTIREVKNTDPDSGVEYEIKFQSS
jgi:predicted Zn finger-like uncharacterized protein